MGYTHYWTVTRDFTENEWSSIVARFSALKFPENSISAGGYFSEFPLVLADGMGSKGSKPIVNRNEIVFNGSGSDFDLSHETMVLERKASRNFCKTARKPYDLAVCSLLLIAYYVAPDAIDVSSDGDIEDWKPAVWFLENSMVLNNSHLPGFIRAQISADNGDY